MHGFPLVFDPHEVGRIARERLGVAADGSAQPATVDEYLAYRDLVIDFVEAQNCRIAKRKLISMTSDAYPRWRFFPAFQPPPSWVYELTGIFASSRHAIDSMVEHAKRMESDDVLRVLADDMETKMGFTVERGKKRLGKLPRPVFFGDQGSYLRTYEIDAFEPTIGIALEVEAGRATMGNAIYRDLIQGSLMVDARFLALAVPLEYRYQSGARLAREPSYAKTYSVVEAIYGSPRLALPFDGLLLIGY